MTRQKKTKHKISNKKTSSKSTNFTPFNNSTVHNSVLSYHSITTPCKTMHTRREMYASWPQQKLPYCATRVRRAHYRQKMNHVKDARCAPRWNPLSWSFLLTVSFYIWSFMTWLLSLDCQRVKIVLRKWYFKVKLLQIIQINHLNEKVYISLCMISKHLK